MARLYQKINNEAVPLGGGGGGSVAIDNDTITKNSDDEIQVATALTGKINQLNNVAADMGKVLTANGDGTAEWDDVLVPIDYETITKNSNGELQVSSVPYDNTDSGLTADNVQDAIDEVNSNLISKLSGSLSNPRNLGTTQTNSVKKVGQWVLLQFRTYNENAGSQISSNTTIGTLSAEFRPKSRQQYPITVSKDKFGSPQTQYISIETSGEVKILSTGLYFDIYAICWYNLEL